MAKELDCLVLGGAGMLGHKVLQHFVTAGANVGCTLHSSLLAPEIASVGLFSQTAEVLDNFEALTPERAIGRIAELRPRVIINCLGIVKQRASAKDAAKSIAINSLWPHLVALAADGWGGRVIHFSTDCVFSGIKGFYSEGDISDAVDIYGRTKFLGELDQTNTLTIRTSIIGRELANFQSLLEWFISQQGKTVSGFTRAWFSGVTTNYMARLVWKLTSEFPDLTGLYHVAGPRISKYDLLRKVANTFDLDVNIEPDDTLACDRSLVGTRFVQETGIEAPTWDEMLATVVADPTPYKEWQLAT